MTEIDLHDPELKRWQKTNLKLALDGWALHTDYLVDGTRHYAIKDGVTLDTPFPEAMVA